MNSRHISNRHKDFYHNLKKSLQIEGNYVFTSNAITTDLVVLNMKKDVFLYKVVTQNDLENVNIWKTKIHDVYVLAWWKANYVLIYVDENFNEYHREIIEL